MTTRNTNLTKRDIEEALMDKTFADLSLEEVARESNVSSRTFRTYLRIYNIKIPKRFIKKWRGVGKKDDLEKEFIPNTEPLREIPIKQAIQELGRLKVNKSL